MQPSTDANHCIKHFTASDLDGTLPLMYVDIRAPKLVAN